MDKKNKKSGKERTYTKELFRLALNKYVKDNGYDLYEIRRNDGSLYKPFSGKYFNDYVDYEYWKEHGPHTDEVNGGSIVMPVTDTYLNRIKSKIDDEHSNYYDNSDNMNYMGPNIIPNITVRAYPVISLYTYPFGNSKFPLSHSAINGPVKDLSGLWFAISRPPGSKDYNYFYNNCSDSTAAFLEDVFGIQIPRGPGNITTPQLVREEVLKQIPGVREEVRSDGSIRTLIPTDINSYRYYWNNLNAPHYLNLKDDGQRSIPHEEIINSQPRKLIDSPINKDYKSKEIKYDSKLITAKRGNKLIK